MLSRSSLEPGTGHAHATSPIAETEGTGRRDPRELDTAECEAVIDELQRMQVFR
jgi:hypothetical protein